MAFKSLQDVLTMNSVTDDGVEFFKQNPLQFIELIKQNHLLATDFAKSKALDTQALETMLRNTYKTQHKFFSAIVTLIQNSQSEVYFKSPTPSNGTMIDTLINTGKTQWHDTYSSNHYYFTGVNKRYTCIYNSYQIFWAPDSNYKSGGDKTKLHYASIHTLLSCYRQATHDNTVYIALILICKDLMAKLQTPLILQGEFLPNSFQQKTNLIFPWLFGCTGSYAYEVIQKCIKFMTVAQLLHELPQKPNQNDYLRKLIDDYPAKKVIMDEVFIKLRLAAAQNPQAFRAQFLDKFPYNILHEMQKKNADLALEFYNIEPEQIGKKYPEHILNNYPRPAPRAVPAVVENDNENPLPILSVANFIQEARSLHISELNTLLKKYPSNVTQQNVADELRRQAHALSDNAKDRAKIQLDINLLNNTNSALHYYLRGYVLSRLRTQLIVDLEQELRNRRAHVTLTLNPDVGSSTSSLSVIRPVKEGEREEMRTQLQQKLTEL